MAIGDVYNILLVGSIFSQLTINSFHYVRDGVSGAPDPDDFCDAFIAMFNDDLLIPLAGAAHFDEVRIKDVNPAGFEFVRLGVGLTGGISGDALPPQDCFSFLYQRTNRTTFHGHKRFAGVPESGNVNGLLASGYLALLETAAAALGSTITASGLDYLPCIYSTVLNGVPRTTPVVNLVKAVVVKGISTQNTRKYGRGA